MAIVGVVLGLGDGVGLVEAIGEGVGVGVGEELQLLRSSPRAIPDATKTVDFIDLSILQTYPLSLGMNAEERR